MSKKKWKVRVTSNMRAESGTGQKVDIFPGNYTMREQDEVSYLLSFGQSVTVRLGIREVLRARESGVLVVEGRRWP
jgi:hypothetical protein